MEFNPFSEDFFDDPLDTYRWLRDESPVYHSERYGFWALSRFDDVARAHRDWRTFTSTHGVSIDQLQAPGLSDTGSIITMDPPEHDRMRKLVSRAFTPRALEAMEPIVRSVIRQYLKPHIGTSFDVVAEFSGPFPVEIISAILGVPEGDRQQIRHWTDDMLHREPDDPATTPAGIEAGMKLGTYAYELAREKRAHPADDMITRLTQVEVEDDNGNMTNLTDAEIAGFATLLAAAGSETVTKLVGSGAVLFARNPEQWAKVVEDADCLTFGIEEILRYLPPSQYQGRFSLSDADFHGATLPAGAPVLLVTGAATRDERA
jgi:cytochrome P450